MADRKLRWLAALLALVITPAAQADKVYAIRDARDLEALFVQLKYTRKDWEGGVRAVPRLYLEDIPSSWREKTSKEFTVAEKKDLFFRLLAPVVLYVNERILENRSRLEGLARQVGQEKPLANADIIWLRELAARYQPTVAANAPFDAERMTELLRRVDVIPPSLALAQGAAESGWGTSRFADEGNSLFGQWSWSGGIKPAQQRSGAHGDHRIAAFESTGLSVASYALNLNTGGAYREFRTKREDLRRRGQPIRGTDLVDTMTRYSERGNAYVDELKTLMRQNKLHVADDARLTQMEIIRIVPKAPQPKR